MFSYDLESYFVVNLLKTLHQRVVKLSWLCLEILQHFLKRPRINYKIKCTAVPKNFDACRIKKWVAFYIWAIKHRNACVYSCNELLNLAWYKYVYFVAATSTILKQRYRINLQYCYSNHLVLFFCTYSSCIDTELSQKCQKGFSQVITFLW